MKNTIDQFQPKQGHVYYTFDGQGEIITFNTGSSYKTSDGDKKDVLPIALACGGEVWVTNSRELPFSRKRQDVFETYTDASIEKGKRKEAGLM